MLRALAHLAATTMLLYGWRRALAAFASGAAGALALPPFDLFLVLFLSMPVLVWLMDATASDPVRGPLGLAASGFRTGWLFGFGYFLAGLWWIGAAFLVEADRFAWMLPIAVLALPAILACFWGFACALAVLVWKPGWSRLLALSGCLAAAEYARANVLTGFPWNAIGYGAMPSPVAMQGASLVGLHGMTLLALAVFSAVALVPADGRWRAGDRLLAVFLVVLAIGNLGYGAWRLQVTQENNVEGVTLRLVQPAIAQSEKWSEQYQAEVFSTLLSTSARETLGNVTHLIWPESAFPFVLTQRRDALAALADLLPDNTMLIAGALRVEPPTPGSTRERVFNAIVTIDGNGQIGQAYDKVHLVPMGEYLPMQELAEQIGLMQLTHLQGGFEAGSMRTPMDAGKAGSFLPLICYEAVFPQEARNDARAGFLLNLTNDAWFGITPGPYQHARQALLRGVEQGLPVVRVANSGISFIADPLGRMTVRLELGTRGARDGALPAPLSPTLYARYADWPFLALLIGFMLVAAIAPRRL